MVLLIGLLTLVMVLDCVILILLVLIQLPKKDAGAGLAFGGAATDALFGAGSGNVLTKTTKYAAGAFFGLAIVLSVMQSNLYHRRANEFRRNLQQSEMPAPRPAAPPATTPATTTPSAPVVAPGTNQLLLVPQDSKPAAPASNAPAAPPK